MVRSADIATKRTALFVVEDVDMAKLMIELGANASHRNGEDETVSQIRLHIQSQLKLAVLQAAQRHLEENPTISAYLASITNEEIDLPSAEDQQDMDLDRSVDQSSSALMSQVQDIMLQSERDGTDPEPALREIVTSVVTGAAQEGQAIGADSLDAESNTRPRPPVAER